eukprot:s13_g11.t1
MWRRNNLKKCLFVFAIVFLKKGFDFFQFGLPPLADTSLIGRFTMSPKKAGYASGSQDPEVDALIAQMLAMGLDDFMTEVPASSDDSLASLLPKLLDVAEQMGEKAKMVKNEMKERAKESNKLNREQKAKEQRNSVMSRRSRMLNSFNLGNPTDGIKKGKTRSISLKKADGDDLATRPRATIQKMKLTSPCRLEATIIEGDDDEEDDDASDDE